MDNVNLRSLFSNYNFPKVEIATKPSVSHEEKLRQAASNLSNYADFHQVINKLYEIKGADIVKNDPALQLLDKLREFSNS